MGKGESAEGAEAGSDISTTETTVEDKKQSAMEPTAETAEQPAPEKASDTETATEQATGDKKEDVENLRTVIKVNEKENQTEEKKEEAPTEERKEEKTEKIISPKIPEPAAIPIGDSKEELEQRRNMLQSIKDFDFQIKKNQEDIGKIDGKIGGLTKDLDDLVSLYEIVSEQMNPFVGLSKVTKKRIDALENFTHEIEEIKTRMGDVESELEKGIGGISVIKKKLEKPAVPTEDVVSTSSPLNTIQFAAGDLSDDDLEKILSKSLEDLLAEQNIDNMIDEFLLSLK